MVLNVIGSGICLCNYLSKKLTLNAKNSYLSVIKILENYIHMTDIFGGAQDESNLKNNFRLTIV